MKLELVAITVLTVRNGLCRKLRTDAAAASGAVLDDDGLTHPAREVLTDGACGHVYAAPGAIGTMNRNGRLGKGSVRCGSAACGAEPASSAAAVTSLESFLNAVSSRTRLVQRRLDSGPG